VPPRKPKVEPKCKTNSVTFFLIIFSLLKLLNFLFYKQFGELNRELNLTKVFTCFYLITLHLPFFTFGGSTAQTRIFTSIKNALKVKIILQKKKSNSCLLQIKRAFEYCALIVKISC